MRNRHNSVAPNDESMMINDPSTQRFGMDTSRNRKQFGTVTQGDDVFDGSNYASTRQVRNVSLPGIQSKRSIL